MSDMLQTARLLIVDDNVANICLMSNILNRLGFPFIESTTDPRETFTLLERFKPDLILLDLNMPHLDGFAVMQQLSRLIPREAFLPILVVSNEASGDTTRRALASGAADIQAKPFNSSELFMRVRNLLQMRFMHRQLQVQNETLELKVAERTRELRQTQQQIISQERLRAFGEMAGGIVHDFNNALMSVIGYSELLLHDQEQLADIPTTRRFLQIINTAGQDASHVISRLRDFYRPREAIDLFSRVDMNEIIEQCVSLTQPKWKDYALAEGRKIVLVLDLGKVPAILGNASDLREIATNLVFNAVDAMPHGGTITLRSSAEAGDVIFEVIDTGVGMTEEVRQRCLEPFFSTKGEKGTGLGLSMVFGIVSRHDGTVEIDSLEGKGTTFRVRLPAQITVQNLAAEDDFDLGRSLHVLVVDDEPIARDVIARYLVTDGHRVVTAINGHEAIDLMKANRFDLLITDHAMPGMNGEQLAAAVRQIRVGIGIVMVTGFGESRVDSSELQGDIDLVMRKPVPRRELRRALVSVLGMGPAMDQESFIREPLRAAS
ncbi:MAG: response regulator [Chthoniobacteraceae bacterium]